VDGIEKEWNGKLKVVRINVQDDVGRELSPVYDFEYTPTYIFFDGQGREVWRMIGEINPQQVRDSVLGNN
jgi:thioredoxin-related protein